ncbi:MAG TPA: DUF3530 family protein [Casimicrobiaceae bacterium]|jgi:hypothetical protein
MRAFVLALAMGAASGACAVTADYAREDRLVDEIVPAIVVGDPVYLATPRRPRVLAIFTLPQVPPIGAAVIVHGLGVHADWRLVNSLRTDLADAGMATLSVQMPVLAADAPRTDYAKLFPEAGERIAAGIEFLRNRRIAKIAIVAHSLGAEMTDAYLAFSAAVPPSAWVPIGMPVDFASNPAEPVLDIVAQNDFAEVIAAAAARARKLPLDTCSRQVVIAGADHFMGSRRKELSEVVVRFIKEVFEGNCRE